MTLFLDKVKQDNINLRTNPQATKKITKRPSPVPIIYFVVALQIIHSHIGRYVGTNSKL